MKNHEARLVIAAVSTTLLGSDGELQTYCSGMETGLRFAFRHPEYARLLLMRVDEEMKADGADDGRIMAERAIDGVIQLLPLNEELSL